MNIIRMFGMVFRIQMIVSFGFQPLISLLISQYQYHFSMMGNVHDKMGNGQFTPAREATQ
jgi:hypothetical protein